MDAVDAGEQHQHQHGHAASGAVNGPTTGGPAAPEGALLANRASAAWPPLGPAAAAVARSGLGGSVYRGRTQTQRFTPSAFPASAVHVLAERGDLARLVRERAREERARRR